MRKLLTSIFALTLAACSGVSAFAQSNPFALHVYYASDFGQYAIQSQAPNQFTFSPASQCQATIPGASATFQVFATNAPIEIVDVNAANNEVLTPSAVVQTAASCGFRGTVANNHNTFKVISGTAGLQEALNNLAVPTVAYPARIVLDRGWYALAAAIPGTTPAKIIAAAKGNAKAFLADTSVYPETFYAWNGTQYVAINGVTGGNTAPTLATGSGAGTAPTASLVSGNGSQGVVSLLSGSAPAATATIFTLTWPTAANGGFSYLPSCTIQSIGSNAYTAGTNAVAYNPPAVDTFTSSTALTAATQYYFKYTCQ